MTAHTDLNRYLDITKAHRDLAAIGTDAARVASLARACPFDDGGGAYDRPLHDALAIHLDSAADVAVGDASPVVPTAVDAAYAIALAEALEQLEAVAAGIARRASAVRMSLDAGLITKPREWSADAINAGAMLDALASGGGVDYEWYAFDNMHLAGCVDALNRERLAGGIDADTYDRHMARIASVSGVVGHEPPGDHERVQNALTQWREDEAEAAAVLAAPDDAGFATLRHRQAINGARTYARLATFAADLTGPAWDAERRRADLHMALVYRTANKMGTDAHGYGPKSDTAADLFARLDEWRIGAYANRMDAARAVIGGADTPADADAFETLYLALYDAVEFAVSTGQLMDVWNYAVPLPTDKRANIHVGVLLHFEESRTGTGCPLVDGGDFAEHTKGLRALVDAYPLGMNSNITHAVLYRTYREDIERIPMGGMDAGADTRLVRQWGNVADDAAAGNITRRQLRALRDLVNAKVAEWCDGDEHRAASLMGRLAYWDRITEELNNA